jgi:glutaredoxin
MSDLTPSQSFSVDAVIADPARPVVLFSLSWCSFCRSAKQMLEHLQITCTIYELDRGVFMEPGLNRSVRARLEGLTHSNTLPQLFIGTEAIGGYTDMSGALRSGRLAEILTRHNVPFTLR